MVWDQKGSSIHHRSESTFENFNNANPGWFGDSKIILSDVAKIEIGPESERGFLRANKKSAIDIYIKGIFPLFICCFFCSTVKYYTRTINNDV